MITNEKKILPCCTFWGEERLSTLKNPEDLKIAWNNEKMKFRRTHLNGNYQSIAQLKTVLRWHHKLKNKRKNLSFMRKPFEGKHFSVENFYYELFKNFRNKNIEIKLNLSAKI